MPLYQAMYLTKTSTKNLLKYKRNLAWSTALIPPKFKRSLETSQMMSLPNEQNDVTNIVKLFKIIKFSITI